MSEVGVGGHVVLVQERADASQKWLWITIYPHEMRQCVIRDGVVIREGVVICDDAMQQCHISHTILLRNHSIIIRLYTMMIYIYLPLSLSFVRLSSNRIKPDENQSIY